MEAGDVNNDVVHPEVRAHINSLVSALGGASVEDDGRYKLGDEALEVLRDIKRWIRFYDEKTNRMDVARCLAEANLIGGDLLQILATWPENETDSRFKARIALACFEVMVPLTWPLERDLEKMTINHHRHLPVLQLAQLRYKRDIINFDGAQILHTAVRAALPAMAISIGDRTPRDQGIIKLVLYFLRNMAMIAPQAGVNLEGDESQISRSTTIDAFSYQDIFLVLLTIASNMGEDFRTEDVVVMEIIFHLLKRVDISKLFLNEKDLDKANSAELAAMLRKEAAMKQSYKKGATRHNRFGTMIWVKREDGKMSALSGQDMLVDPALRERKMDSTKNFRPPRRSRKEEMEPKDFGPPVSLNQRAAEQLRSFVEDFLDSGFNPLFQHVRRSLDREAPHVLHEHRGQFFYLVAWFLEAERMRRKSKKAAQPSAGAADINSFNLVAGVLNQEMFISLSRAMDRSYGDKDWQELATIMRCFTQILLTVQEMSESGNEEDEEIADNILSRLFYEEATHDAVANIVRTYKDQGFEYLDACTELTHTYLRILEAYSKQNVDLQVRSRKRVRRKKKAAKTAENDGEVENLDGDGDDSANDEQNAERTSRERKFDFNRFAHRFVPQGVVDTFVCLMKFYNDLNDAQLKRAHRYFYRVAFKQEMSVMLFRLDIIHLFYNMIKGPEPLEKGSSMYKEWEELVRQIIKKCVRKMEERPALITELLFSKINSTAHYLEYGYEKQTVTTNQRPGAELEFRHIVDLEQQIAIAVGVLLDKNQADHLEWVKKQLSTAEAERRAWEAAEKAVPFMEDANASGVEPSIEQTADNTAAPITVRPDDDARRTAMFKNPHLRLLMKLVGIERLEQFVEETPESVWAIPAALTADMLKDSLDLINKAEFSPPTFENDESAEQQLRRKTAPRKKANYDDDGDDVEDFLDDGGALFPKGGPTARQADGEDQGPTKTRRRRRRDGSAEPISDEQLDERARARREKEREKARKIKSDVYVHASDDEDDDERDQAFFAREEEIRKRVQQAILGLTSGGPDKAPKAASGNEPLTLAQVTKAASSSKKRKSTALGDSDEDEASDASSESETARSNKSKRRRRPVVAIDSDTEEEEMGSTQQSQQTRSGMDVDDEPVGELDTDDTPMSSSPRSSAEKGSAAALPASQDAGGDDADEDEGPVAVKARMRVRAGFVVDSSDEE